MGLGNEGVNPSLSDPTSHQTLRGGASKGWEDRESHQRDATSGWRGGRFEGRALRVRGSAQAQVVVGTHTLMRPCSRFEAYDC